MPNNYLITGSNGFIGGALLKELNSSDRYGLCLAFEEEDVSLPDWEEKLELQVKSVDIIFHIGAISSTDASDINKTMFLNYEFSKILFDLAAKYNKKVIYSSSAAIYGDGDGIPKNLYAWSKKAAEDYGLLKVKEFISLRYFNVYGPGENHKGKMASIANQAFHHHKKYPKEPFYLFGGKPTRDFVYIKDVVSANLFAVPNDIKTGIYEVGSGESHTFEKVLDLMGYRYFYKEMKDIPSWYQFKTCANPERFLPNWKPEYNLEKVVGEYKRYLENCL